MEVLIGTARATSSAGSGSLSPGHSQLPAIWQLQLKTTARFVCFWKLLRLIGCLRTYLVTNLLLLDIVFDLSSQQ